MFKWQICRFSHISGKVNNSYKLHSHQFSWKLIFLSLFPPEFFALSKIYHFWSDTKNIFISAKREKAFAIWWKTSLGNCSIFLLSSKGTQNVLCFWGVSCDVQEPKLWQLHLKLKQIIYICHYFCSGLFSLAIYVRKIFCWKQTIHLQSITAIKSVIDRIIWPVSKVNWPQNQTLVWCTLCY